jgi:alpha-ribazole phosphatase
MTGTLIDLIRHGEPAGGRRYRGHGLDDPLTEKGWSQMWDAVGEFSAWQQIITSPMQRCQAFAHALGERHAIPVHCCPVNEKAQRPDSGLIGIISFRITC